MPNAGVGVKGRGVAPAPCQPYLWEVSAAKPTTNALLAGSRAPHSASNSSGEVPVTARSAPTMSEETRR